MWEKLKSIEQDDSWYFALLLVCVAVASFGLGRQSVAPAPSTQPGAVQLHETPTPAPAAGVEVVASQQGTKYHLPDCPGAKRIHDENRVAFASPELAQAAGYEPAANCPGL